MKNFVFVLLVSFLFFNKNLAAQIIITSASFPVAGDTLSEAVDNSPTIDNGNPGSNQTWDFTKLKANAIRKTAVRPAAEGAASASFPGANLLFKQLGGANAQQQYMKSSTSKIEYIGYDGAVAGGVAGNVRAAFNPAEILRRAPMKFFDNSSTNSALNITVPASIIPDSLLANFPVKPDSIRIKFKSNRLDLVDGWGKANIPNGSFDVLREKRTNYTETSIEIKVPLIGWFDVTNLLGGAGGGVGAAFGKDTTVQYYYFAQEAKEPIAIVNVDALDNSKVLTASFKPINVKVVSINDVLDVADANSLNLYPNPAVNEVNMKFTDLPSGNYQLVVYNILGRQMMKKHYFLNGNTTIREDVSSLPNGNFLFSLSNQRGKIVNTKRLVILRP